MVGRYVMVVELAHNLELSVNLMTTIIVNSIDSFVSTVCIKYNMEQLLWGVNSVKNSFV